MLEPVLITLLLCLSLITWSILYLHRKPGQPWVAYAPRRTVPWGLLDVFVALALLFVLATIVVGALGMGAGGRTAATVPLADVNRQTIRILADALVSLAVVTTSAVLIWVRFRATGADLGWSTARIRSDVRLGVVAFLALAPPVYALQMCLVHWVKSSHPLVELMRQYPRPPLIAACVVSAVFVAPIVEEYLFRGLLQGWLERLADGRDEVLDMIVGGPARVPMTASDVTSGKANATPAPWIGGSDPANPDGATECSADAAPDESRDLAAASPLAAHGPIFVSAFAFAILHFAHGPDWIPLFLLAVGLGYLYRQTHRLLPAIVVHFLLNACSMAMILVQVLSA